MSCFDVIIIGAGASGLMCALTAGRRGRRVQVVDRNSRVGRKLLMTGGGRCNFTNRFISPECYISANPRFCISALKRYSQQDFITMVETHGIGYHERSHGQLFCNHSAGDILRMLLAECEQAGVDIRTGCEITSVEALEHGDRAAERFRVTYEQGVMTSTSLVVATGGLSIPETGSSGFGYHLARQFGMRVLPTRAGLVPFTLSGAFRAMSERLTGISQEAALSTGNVTFTENLLFTHRGLSGPAVLQLSNYWQPGDSIAVDLLPGTDMGQWLRQIKSLHPKSLLRNLLAQRLPKRLVQELQPLLWPSWAERPIAELPDSVLDHVAEGVNRWTFKPAGTEGYRTAEITLGGVDTAQLSSKTMESRIRPGLYFIGEVVDITGHLGGFNLQWAWSSGVAAGQFV